MNSSNIITIDLDKRIARAQFASGVEYVFMPLTMATPVVRTPENEKKIAFWEQQHNVETGALVGRPRELYYQDLREASFDSSLPSVARYLLQGLMGIPI